MTSRPSIVTAAVTVCATFLLASCSEGEGAAIEETDEHESALTHSPYAAKELFITDLSVVNNTTLTRYKPGKWNTDKEGAFSFGRLIDNMSAKEKPSDQERSSFVMEWLLQWETDQVVNGQLIAARPLIRGVIITPWKLTSIGVNGNTSTKCNASPATDFTCKLSFLPADVPFRLLAVVNRPDLRRVPSSSNAQDGSAGQGRFVFGALGSTGAPLPFTVIFEYMVPVSGKSDIKARAEKWHELGEQSFGSSLNDKLHDVSLSFAKWNVAPWRNNGSALLQIRTNEVSLAEAGSDPSNPFGVMWEMREFVIGSNGKLQSDTVKQEPPISASGGAQLTQWVNDNEAAVLDGTHVVPSSTGGMPFLAASSLIPFDFVWQIPGVSAAARDNFSKSTCNGCHRAETSTFFLHVLNREPAAQAGLSPFLQAELDAGGPRLADFEWVLTTDWSNIEDGPGEDHSGGKEKKKK